MRLRKSCEHDRYDAHRPGFEPYHECPGGQLLAVDVLVIERDSDGWVISNKAFSAALDAGQRAGAVTLNGLESALFAYFDALAADQVGEPR